jgi:hypothetical protein
MLFEIKTGYDPSGNFDRKYTELKANLAGTKRGREPLDEDDHEEDDEIAAAKFCTVQKKDVKIERGRVGIVMPQRNAFDYIVRPKEASDS